MSQPAFGELAHAWLRHLEVVEDAKPSILIDHPALLAHPASRFADALVRSWRRVRTEEA